MGRQSASGGKSIRAPGAHRGDVVIGFDDVPTAAEDQAFLLIGGNQQRLESPQSPVRSPVLGQFDGCPLEIAVILLELAFEPLEQGEGVRGGACKACKDLLIVHFANLFRLVFDHCIPQGHLPVARHDHGAIFAHGKYGRSVHCIESHETSTPYILTRGLGSGAHQLFATARMSGVIGFHQLIHMHMGVALGS